MANQEKFFVEYGVDTDSTSSFKVPTGTTAQRDSSPESGLFRYNTSNNQFEGYSNGSWGAIGGGSLGQSFDVDTFTGDNSTTAFTLSRSVSSEDYLIVFIDGVFQGQGSYVLSGTTLTLDSPPATGSSIIAYSVEPISVAEIPADTDDLTEGSTNLYFTNARVDSRLSSGSVATIETTGNVTVGGDLSVSGGLTVSGTTTTVNSTTTSVTDSMIELANSNTSSDVIDIGIYGNYDDGLSDGGATEYTGLFRDASDSTWKLFDGLEEEPSTTVNTAGTNYAKAALEVGDLDATTIITTDINLENTGGNAVLDIKASNTGLSRVNLGDTDGSTRGGLKYDHSDDSMAFRANGSDQMTLTNTGLGIGTSSPVAPLTINDKATFSFNSSDFAIGHQLYYDGGDDRWERLTGNAGSAIYQTAGNVLFYRTSAGGATGDSVTPSESMRIASGGQVLINTTGTFSSSSAKLYVTGTGGMCIRTNDYPEYQPLILHNNASTANNSSTLNYITFQSLSNGTVGTITSVGTTTSYNTSSDYRLKENVDYTWDATTRLKQLKPARFNWIADADTTVEGFLAHEVSSIVPEAITGEKDATETKQNCVLNAAGKIEIDNITEAEWIAGKEEGTYASDTTWTASHTQDLYQSIDQSKLVPLLTKAIQEQQTIIEDLRTRIETLENA